MLGGGAVSVAFCGVQLSLSVVLCLGWALAEVWIVGGSNLQVVASKPSGPRKLVISFVLDGIRVGDWIPSDLPSRRSCGR